MNSNKQKNMTGKIAVITGAARGIGRATSVALAHEGATIIGIDICADIFPASGVKPATKADLEETGRLVIAAGAVWKSYIKDQRDFESLKETVAAIEEEFGGIDILFANAGIQGFASLLEMDSNHWDIQIENNLTGTCHAIRAFAPSLIKRGGGRIIVTSSGQGRHGTLNGAAYSASKWGIIGLMKSAAKELGKYNITVNALIPGLIDTPLTRHEARYAEALQSAGKVPVGIEEIDEKTAAETLAHGNVLGVPWIEPEDIAPVVVFLASDAARMVTGGTFDATAGDSTGWM